MPHPVVHWEIGGKDMKKSQEFYSRLFDWKIDANNPMNYGMVDTGGGGINGGLCEAPDGKPYFIMYIQVDDLQKYLDKATALGGQVVTPPTPIPGIGSYAVFKDLDGNVIGLYKSN
jgi:uncharacterized protein